MNRGRHAKMHLKGPCRVVAWLAAAVTLSACGMQPESASSPAGKGSPAAETVRSVARGLETSLSPWASGTAPDRTLRMREGSSPQRIASVRMTERARRLLRSGQYTLALSELEKSLSVDGSNPYAHYYIALSHYHLRNYPASLNFLDASQAVLGHDLPWLVQSLVLRGDNLRALGRFAPAKAAYRRALAMDPTNPSAHRGLQWARQRSKVQSW